MKTNAKNLIIIIISFLLSAIIFGQFNYILLAIHPYLKFKSLSYFCTYFIVGVPILIGTFIVDSERKILKILGFKSNILKALLFGIIATSPMFIGSFFSFNINPSLTISKILVSTLLAGFFEELYFRSFLFGLVFQKTKFGFIPAIILGAIIFALGHIYQSQNIKEIIGIFITTFLGSLFFAWLYVEWNYNIWIPIFLHTLMNLSWVLFSVSENALGNVNSNIFRIITITSSIIITIIYKRKRNEKFTINRKTLFVKNNI